MPAPRPPAIRVTACASRSARSPCSTASTSRSPPAPCSPCSAPTAPARPRPSTSSPRWSAPTPARRRSPATTSRPTPYAVRAAIGVTGQFSAVDTLLTAEENLRLMADLHHLPRAEGRDPRGRPARALRAVGRRRQARGRVLGRHAAQARPGDDPDGRPVGDLPRRADDGPRPAQPARDVGRRPRPGRRRGDGPAHDAVPRGGRPAGPRRSRSSTADGSSRRARRPSSSDASPAAASGCGWPTPTPSARPRSSSPAPRATTRHSRSASRAPATSPPCATCSTASTERPSRPSTWT